MALLLELGEPTHAYLLATLLARRLGPASKVEAEAIYKMLPALQRAGLVDCELGEIETGGSWRRLNLWRTNDLTERAVNEWMAQSVSYAVARADLQVKIAFSRPSDAPVLLAALDVFEMQCMEQLTACEEADGVPMARWSGLALNTACSWAEEHLKADLSWVMSTRESMNEYLAGHGATGR
jgi:DNA-binding PadR family transcriptional regulator